MSARGSAPQGDMGVFTTELQFQLRSIVRCPGLCVTWREWLVGHLQGTTRGSPKKPPSTRVQPHLPYLHVLTQMFFLYVMYWVLKYFLLRFTFNSGGWQIHKISSFEENLEPLKSNFVSSSEMPNRPFYSILIQSLLRESVAGEMEKCGSIKIILEVESSRLNDLWNVISEGARDIRRDSPISHFLCDWVNNSAVLWDVNE